MKSNSIAGLALAVSLALAPLIPSPSLAQTGRGFGSGVSRTPVRSLEARVETDRTQYRPNRAVEITMTLTNLAENRHMVSTAGKYQYDFVVRNIRTGQAVFTLSKNRPRLPREGFTMDGGETRTYEELWDQTDDTGRPVPTGVYRVEATIYPQNTVSTQIFVTNRGGGEQPVPPTDPDPETPRPPQNSPLQTEIAVEDTTVRPGSRVAFAYTVQNSNRQPVNLRFSSGQRFDATVTDANGRVVWRMSSGMMYTQALGQLSLAPGGKQIFRGIWNVPESLNGGRYSLNAFLTPMDSPRGNVGLASTLLTVGGGIGPGTPGGGIPVVPGQGAAQISLRILLAPSGVSFVGQRLMLIGKYNGREGGVGAPPATRNDWVLSSDGLTIYVTGRTPTADVGNTITVTGVARRAADGRIYIQAD